MPKPPTIGRIAALADVHIETIRYYERRGLLPDPPRTESGYRQYDAESVIRLRFIKEAQALGFTLEEIQGLLALRVDKETSCEDVRRRAEHKVADIEAKISALQAMHDALQEMIAACAQGGPSGECPLLETLERNAQERTGGS
ncbi:MAG: MerR family DNA-binding protein [Caldilineaceae bacterium]|nr:MerR family DNA-binding protein [Caldilineaceae bacterium]HRJ44942.1 MerR family DNA-binding protein [Caldilineaceae bacterium]